MLTDTLSQPFSLICNICDFEKKYAAEKGIGSHIIHFSPPPQMVVIELKN